MVVAKMAKIQVILLFINTIGIVLFLMKVTKSFPMLENDVCWIFDMKYCESQALIVGCILGHRLPTI